MSRLHAALATALMLLAACGGGAGYAGELIDGAPATMTLTSAFTGADYGIWVTLPDDYAISDRSYPVIVVTDAEFLRSIVTAEVRARGYQAIVVAIGNNARRLVDYPPTVSNTDQSPGGGVAYYRFVAEELVPAIDAQYRVDTAFGRTLGGYSLGGLFTLYAFLQERPEHRVFTHFIAGSPSIWYSATLLQSEEARWAAATPALDATLFMATGGAEGGMVDDMMTAAGVLDAAGVAGLTVTTQVNAGLDHSGNTVPSMREGLATVFR